MSAVPSRWLRACDQLGFEERQQVLPLFGLVSVSWEGRHDGSPVTLRLSEIDGERYAVVSVPLSPRLRCGLWAATMPETEADKQLGRSPVEVAGLPATWQVKAFDPQRARRLLRRLAPLLAAAHERGRELLLSDDSLQLWLAGVPDAGELQEAVAAALALGRRLGRRAAKVKPPAWERQARADWPRFAAARGLDFDAEKLRLHGLTRASTAYRDGRELAVEIGVDEDGQGASRQLRVTVELPRPLARSAGFIPASAGGGEALLGLLGLRVFPASREAGGDERFVVTAASEQDAEPLLLEPVRAALAALPDAAFRGRLEGCKLHVWAAEVLTGSEELGELLDGVLHLGEELQEHAPQLGSEAAAPQPPAGAAPRVAPGPSPAAVRQRQRRALMVLGALGALIAGTLAYLHWSRPAVGERCSRDSDCRSGGFCLQISAHQRARPPAGADSLTRRIYELSDGITDPLAPDKDYARQVPLSGGYCSVSCRTDDDCPRPLRCSRVRLYQRSVLGQDWIRGRGTERQACVR